MGILPLEHIPNAILNCRFLAQELIIANAAPHPQSPQRIVQPARFGSGLADR